MRRQLRSIPEQERQSDDEEYQDESDGGDGVNPQLHSSICAAGEKFYCGASKKKKINRKTTNSNNSSDFKMFTPVKSCAQALITSNGGCIAYPSHGFQ